MFNDSLSYENATILNTQNSPNKKVFAIYDDKKLNIEKYFMLILYCRFCQSYMKEKNLRYSVTLP